MEFPSKLQAEMSLMPFRTISVSSGEYYTQSANLSLTAFIQKKKMEKNNTHSSVFFLFLEIIES